MQFTSPTGPRTRITFSRDYAAAMRKLENDAPSFYTELMCPSCQSGAACGHPSCEDLHRARTAWEAGDLAYLETRGWEVYDFETARA